MNTNKPINDLTTIPSVDLINDFIPILDVTDGRAKKISPNTLGPLLPVNASNISTGTLADARLSANVTLQGNTFNGVNQLVQLDGSGALVSAVITATNLTTQGNVFNTASKLVQLDSSTRLPAVDGSLVTTLNATAVSSGTLADARLSANVTIQGNTFNGANQLVKLNASSLLPACSGINLTDLNANNINAGTVANARLTSSVTLQSNTFNGVNQLVQLDGSTQLPAVSGVNLTNLNASAINSGALADARLSTNVSLKVKPIVSIAAATVQILSDFNKDSIFVVGHPSGTVNFNLPNTPTVSAGVSFTIVTNTVQAISFTCDTLASAYYINSGGTGATIASGATLAPSNQRGRVITVTCINASTYAISGAGL
jgi:hypothetical protein